MIGTGFVYSLDGKHYDRQPKQEGNFAKSVSCGGLATKSIMQYAVSECIAAMHFIGNYAEFNSLGAGLTAADTEPTAE